MSEEASLESIRNAMRSAIAAPEWPTVRRYLDALGWDASTRAEVSARAQARVEALRAESHSDLMDSFLVEYSLSSREGVALMCLAEALLRVPDADTMDALIADKVAPSDWGRHLGQATSSLVNASTWALMLTGRMLGPEDEGVVGTLHGLLRRLGEPVVRTAVAQAMRELGHQFVFGRDIEEARERAEPMEARGYTFSYDMLGEAARTGADARRYHLAYSDAIAGLASRCSNASIRDNPGISVKLSALHERYELAQRERVCSELVARTRSLAVLAHSANMGFNIDAEEADRLDLSLDVIEAVLSDPSLAGWEGFGVVVQAYGPRAPAVLDWLYALARRLDRRIMVRLVKGAYWDTEIKRAQVLGLAGYPVFTRKLSTDVSYIHCARRLLEMSDHIYPQFATHNAHTASAILHLAGERGADGFEFQRLHGMGEELHEGLMRESGGRCRIYAPVGAHGDLLAYLVRRLLENGANSSFVHQLMDRAVDPATIAADPLSQAETLADSLPHPAVGPPRRLFGAERESAAGLDLGDPAAVVALDTARGAFHEARWSAAARLPGGDPGGRPAREVISPAASEQVVGTVSEATPEQVDSALVAASAAARDWAATPVAHRADALRAVADLYEAHTPELMAILAREAGKSVPDAIAEVREAVDFCRYYAAGAGEAEARRPAGARGVIVCISPWNFPLAIFTGQIVAALVAGNCVIAKPAEQTPLIAARAVALMHEAGIPAAALTLLPGDGESVGAALIRDPRVGGVSFTGSTQTARLIDRAMAQHLDWDAPLIAETGGINAMIVDSSALPEQAVRDIVASAFQSAGQRCSALRMLYVQEDVYEPVLEMLRGAMDALVVGDPWELRTDVGPVIDEPARAAIVAHCEALTAAGRRLHTSARGSPPATGRFVLPGLFEVAGIEDLEEEIFGPVLHVAAFRSEDLDAVVAAINACGYGLTFGLHTRVDGRVQSVTQQIRCGNVYVNRNQIGAVVGVQPFGGEGLSGTGPKAGGPAYLLRLRRPTLRAPRATEAATTAPGDWARLTPAVVREEEGWARAPDRASRLRRWLARVEPLLGSAAVRLAAAALDACTDPLFEHAGGGGELTLSGPTGESNRLSLHPRGLFLCLGDGAPELALAQATQALLGGNRVAVGVAGFAAIDEAADRMGIPLCGLGGPPPLDSLARAPIDGVMSALDAAAQASVRRSLAQRPGPLIPLVGSLEEPERLVLERVLSVDTTAAGGNAALLARAAEE